MGIETMKIFSLLLAGILASLLNGCETLPTATYTTADGCGIAQWKESWVQQNVASMNWTGDCGDGLAQGKGTLIVKLKNGKQKRYEGVMAKGGVQGDGIFYDSDGWRLEGNFLWSTFTSGKIFNGKGQIMFDGSIAHNEKFNGQNLTFDDGRYYRGKVYFPDGSYIDDGEYTGAAGYLVGIKSIDPNSGKGFAYGKYVKDGKVVARFVEGVRYDDDRTYGSAKLAYLDKVLARIQAENKKLTRAYEIERAEKNARERKAAMSLLGGLAGAAAEGKNSTERRQLALAAATQALAGGEQGSSSSGENNVSVLDGLGVPSSANCIQIEWISEAVPTSNNVGNIYISTFGPRDSTGRDPTTDRKLMLATNTCVEQVIFYFASCMDFTMLKSSNRAKDSWSAGELTGVWPEFNFIRLKNGQRIIVAESNIFVASDPTMSRKTQPVKVIWGAWQVESLLSPDGTRKTGAGEIFFRRVHLIHKELNRVSRGKADTWNLSSSSGPTPPVFRNWVPEGKSCRTANIKTVWDATQ